ncbi:hypothetical protein EDC04DRAFT_2737145, partial [Pisolithus marmoratus]
GRATYLLCFHRVLPSLRPCYCLGIEPAPNVYTLATLTNLLFSQGQEPSLGIPRKYGSSEPMHATAHQNVVHAVPCER